MMSIGLQRVFAVGKPHCWMHYGYKRSSNASNEKSPHYPVIPLTCIYVAITLNGQFDAPLSSSAP
jgi:hypothetical protein